jgi:ectoine hydroxylase-related dioxygenase (phytanoyl-CoA dioxygenase family)
MTEDAMAAQIDDDTIREFRETGATVLRGVLSDWVETLRAGIAANMDDPDPNARIYRGENGGGRFFVDYCNWARFPDYRRFIFDSPVAEIGAALMDSETVQLFHEHVLVKEAAAGVPTPWHQDAPYYCVDCARTVSIWVPLDPVPRETTLEFVAGSHLWGKSYRPQRFDGSALNENDGLEAMPDIDGNRGDYEIVGWALEPGDAVAFDYRTVHGAPANDSPTRQRRAFSLRLLGEGARFRRQEGIVTSPPFPAVTLQNGEPLVAEEFPVLLNG